jgi:hypothetical protein
MSSNFFESFEEMVAMDSTSSVSYTTKSPLCHIGDMYINGYNIRGDSIEIRLGTRVIFINEQFIPTAMFPLWGAELECIGTVTEIHLPDKVTVRWDNGMTLVKTTFDYFANAPGAEELAISQKEPNPNRAFKRLKEYGKPLDNSVYVSVDYSDWNTAEPTNAELSEIEEIEAELEAENVLREAELLHERREEAVRELREASQIELSEEEARKLRDAGIELRVSEYLAGKSEKRIDDVVHKLREFVKDFEGMDVEEDC